VSKERLVATMGGMLDTMTACLYIGSVTNAPTTTTHTHTHTHARTTTNFPDFARHPRFANMSALEFVMRPGELLFLPGWLVVIFFLVFQSINNMCWRLVFELSQTGNKASSRPPTPTPTDTYTLFIIKHMHI
jgi:hypothetical protein